MNKDTERITDLEHLIFVKAFDKHQDTTEAKLALDLRDCHAHLDALREAVNRALNELGVPQPGYPCPVANAVEILREALTKGGDDDKKNKS